MSNLSMLVSILAVQPLLVRAARWGVLHLSHTKTLWLLNLSANIWLGLKHWRKMNVLISVNYDLLYTIPKHVAILSKQWFRKVNSSEVLSVLICPTGQMDWIFFGIQIYFYVLRGSTTVWKAQTFHLFPLKYTLAAVWNTLWTVASTGPQVFVQTDANHHPGVVSSTGCPFPSF